MAITIASSVIVIALLLYAFWDSLDQLKGINKYLGSFIVIAGLAAWVVSERVETLQHAADAEQEREGTRKARMLEERLKSRTELLDAETRKKLVDRLRELPPGTSCWPLTRMRPRIGSLETPWRQLWGKLAVI